MRALGITPSEPGKRVRDDLPFNGQQYGFAVHGPNGFLRELRGQIGEPHLETTADYDAASGALVLRIKNRGVSDVTVATAANDYSTEAPRRHVLAVSDVLEDRWNIVGSAHWYDISVTSDAAFLHRFAGHIETGEPSFERSRIRQVQNLI